MTRPERLFTWLAAVQIRHPWRLLTLVALTCIPALFGAARLELKTDWTELLPENQRSIQDLRRIQERVGSSGTFIILVEGNDTFALQRLVDDLAARITELPEDMVRSVDKGVKDERAFFERSKYLYAEVSDLVEIRDDLKARIAAKKSEAMFDLGLDEDDDEGSPTGEVTAQPESTDRPILERIRGRYAGAQETLDQYPSGYFAGEDGRALVLRIRTPTSSGNFTATRKLVDAVNGIVAELKPASYHPSIELHYTGGLITVGEEHQAIRNELLVVSLICVSLILGSIYLFYFEFRAILVLGLGILVGVIWTFGITGIHIGYLSTATAFLASIVPGNGINSGLIVIARFLEERRSGRTVDDAVRISLCETWVATFTASLAASLAYGTLMLTDFRGFSQFGFIGGIGLLLCWVGNMLVVPTLLGLTERHRATSTDVSRRGNFGRPFLYLAENYALPALLCSAVLAVAGIAGGYHWLTHDPFEYDFRRLRTDRADTSSSAILQQRVNHIMEARPRDGMMLLLDRPDQVGMLTSALERVRETNHDANGVPPIGDVRSLDSLIPAEQAPKLELLREIRRLAIQVLPELSTTDRAELEPWIPPADLGPIALDDVPATLRRPFREKDGREGLIVYVAPPKGVSVWNGRVLQRFANAVRAVELPSREVVHSSGEPVIFADMLQAILDDGPWLTAASFLAIVVLVIVAFRRPTDISIILLSLIVGMSWMIGCLAVAGLRLNFLNFIAIPITFGIGVDYAVNMVRRYAQDGFGATRAVLMETGGAVILCSLTTIWGYLSLLYSDNQALRSFGKTAVLGELTCLTAAVVVLPSLVTLLIRRRAAREG